MNEILILFTIGTIVNVILSTIKSIATVKGGKGIAALMNALTYGFYSYVIILTTADGLSVWAKMIITALCNFVGVYLVKLLEERFRKTKLWKIECTVPMEESQRMITDSNNRELIFNYIPIGKWCIFNFYSYTKMDSEQVAKMLNNYDAHYFVTEAKSINL